MNCPERSAGRWKLEWTAEHDEIVREYKEQVKNGTANPTRMISKGTKL